MCLLATVAEYEGVGTTAGQLGEPVPINERTLAAVWNEQRLLRGPFWTTGGEPVAIVHRGRWTGMAGPDFRGAIVAIGDSRPQQGDIELHLRAADWFAHGHQNDPAYNDVILHVVYTLGATGGDGLARLGDARHATTADGRQIPTLVLAPHIAATGEELAAITLPDPAPLSDEPCWQRTAHRPIEELLAALGAAGDARLRQKAAQFEGEFAPLLEGLPEYEHEAVVEQVLYAGLCDALGFSANRRPFALLAQRLPLEVLRLLSGSGRHAERVVMLEAALLGEAGLLPVQRGRAGKLDWESEAQADELTMQWNALRPLLAHVAAAEEKPLGWTFAGVRPANNPVRRVAALAHLLAWLLPGGLLAGFLAPLKGTPTPQQLCEAWLARLHVPAPGSFWSEHADFGARLGAAGKSFDLIGQDRAREMLVNIVLPLLLAWSDYGGGRELRRTVEAVYEVHPALAANEVTRVMADEAFGPRARLATKSARMQQGLIHLYRNHCSVRDLNGCPLSGLIKRQS